MKKLMFLTMLFGLLMVFSGNISAQDATNGHLVLDTQLTGAISVAGSAPQEGDRVELGVHFKQDAQKTRQYALKFFDKDSGKLKGMIMLNIPPDEQSRYDKPQVLSSGSLVSDDTNTEPVKGGVDLVGYSSVTAKIPANHHGYIVITLNFKKNAKDLGTMTVSWKDGE